MGCPKDADTTIHRYRCNAQIETDKGVFQCTRKWGHTGRHHSHNKSGECLLKWSMQTDKYFFTQGDIMDTFIAQNLTDSISNHFIYTSKDKRKIRCIKDLEVIVKG